MVLRLDPAVPIVWRTPHSIQLGVDRPLAVIRGVTPALERVLVALRSGIPESGAVMLGREAGASDRQIAGMLRALRPALLGEHPPGRANPPAVCVDGVGNGADRIAELLTDLGLPVLGIPSSVPGDAERGPDAALAVIVGQYVIEPARHGRWLRRDIPHLPVVFSDTEVRYGPLVEPGAGPCLSCLEMTRIDGDSDWPAIAVQLMTRRAPTETPLLTAEAAAAVARLVEGRLESGPAADRDGLSYGIDAETGAVTRRAHQPHERCGCRSLTGNGTVPGEHVAALRRPPSSVRAAAWRG